MQGNCLLPFMSAGPVQAAFLVLQLGEIQEEIKRQSKQICDEII